MVPDMSLHVRSPPETTCHLALATVLLPTSEVGVGNAKATLVPPCSDIPPPLTV